MTPRHLLHRCRILVSLLPLLLGTACSGGDPARPTVTIYTSIYEHVIASLTPVLQQQSAPPHPAVKQPP